ncbi:hypothetical protein DA2_3185 [Desulfovibrio sp. A2]|nr:hypothetical protein DA2_3185 [Desulfovibrio sp. A2]
MSRSLMTEATAQQLLTELRAIREEVEAVRRHLTTSSDAEGALRTWLTAFERLARKPGVVQQDATIVPPFEA